jgi:SAM-dependent methyltransferase
LLGTIIRSRYRLIRPLLPQQPVGTLMELGYGSGIFLPTLKQYCDRLLALDIHEHRREVNERLAPLGVRAELMRASAESIPLDDASVDCIVAVSSLEFVPDLEAAASELQRVLRPTGTLVIATPGYSRLTDLGLKLFTGESAERDYGDRRHRLLPALQARFIVEQQRSFPWLLSRLVKIYTAIRLKPRPRMPTPQAATPGEEDS